LRNPDPVETNKGPGVGACRVSQEATSWRSTGLPKTTRGLVAQEEGRHGATSQLRFDASCARPARDRFQEATRDSLSMRPHRSWTRARGQDVFHRLTRIVVVGASLCANSRAEAQSIRQDLYVTNGLVR